MPRTVTKLAYQFDELTDKAKERALLEMCDINTMDDWYEFVVEDAKKMLLSKGIACNRIFFDLGRSQECYLDSPSADDWRLFVREAIKAGHSLSVAELRNLIERDGLYIESSKRLSCQVYSDYSDIPPLNNYLYSLLQDILSSLTQEYEYLNSEEAVTETIRANEYEFDENGYF